MLDAAHGIMFVGTCLCIISFCAGFSLGRVYQEHNESETINEEKIRTIAEETVAKALSRIMTARNNKP